MKNKSDTLILTRSSSRNCKMTFIIGRGFAERQILKKGKWPYLLNWVEYFDKLLRKHWNWHDLAQEIVKWHFSLVEALPSSKFWKIVNGAISWTEWNIVMKLCINTDIDKMYPMRLSNDIWDWLSLWRGSNSGKSESIAKWHLSSVEALPERQILKKWKWLYLLNWVEYFDRLLREHWYWQNLAQERLWNVIFHRSRFCRAPISEKVKMALSLELSGILWWNLAYTLVLIRCSPWGCQMTFGIGRGFAEV